jgi:hypothetical protein
MLRQERQIEYRGCDSGFAYYGYCNKIAFSSIFIAGTPKYRLLFRIWKGKFRPEHKSA